MNKSEKEIISHYIKQAGKAAELSQQASDRNDLAKAELYYQIMRQYNNQIRIIRQRNN